MKKAKHKLIFLPDPSSPLVFVDFALRHGSLADPVGKEGLASVTLSMLLRGTVKQSSEDFHRTLDDLGAELHLGKLKESLRVYGVTMGKNLPEFLDLFEEMITSPRFDELEFRKVKDQFKSALIDELGSDEDIAERRFQEYMLFGNAYGRITSGSLKSLENIELEDVRKFHAQYFCAEDAIFSATGSFVEAKLAKRAKQLLDRLPQRNHAVVTAPAPELPKGRNLLLLDKPGRTQAQLYIGASGISFRDEDYLPLMIANHVFGGGSFSARLMHEVREKRGWSYGCNSWYRGGKVPLYMGMQAVPSNKDAVGAMKLMVKLFESYAKKGITKKEFDFAKKSLLNQSAFMQDTLRKRLDNKITAELLGLPMNYFDSYGKRLKAVTYAKVQKAISRKVNSKNLFMLMLTTVSEIEKDLPSLKVKAKVVRKFDEDAVKLF